MSILMLYKLTRAVFIYETGFVKKDKFDVASCFKQYERENK